MYPYISEDKATAVASAIFNSSYSFGELIGPFLGGLFMEKLYFNWTSTIVGLL